MYIVTNNWEFNWNCEYWCESLPIACESEDLTQKASSQGCRSWSWRRLYSSTCVYVQCRISLRNKPEKNEWHVNRTHTFKPYHCISLFRLGLLKLAKHFLPKHHSCHKGTWLSGKSWAVKWMLHDIMQMSGISCLIHNIPLLVQDKKQKNTDKSFASNILLTGSSPAAYIWGNSDTWESLAKLHDLYRAEWRSRFFLKNLFCKEKNTAPWNT